MIDDKAYITDNGNYIFDCHFGSIEDSQELHDKINRIPGVVDNGLFVNMTRKVIVGYQDGEIRELEKRI
ncbi:Ribose-5-phosphate isomerase A [bioreactor metagenome]|uniref:Ribose-5-phosphate isomerase A n=1 Tax=bioreactor metagenome TaxID=1076179 RepID=A0A645INF3_9ZZZZ